MQENATITATVNAYASMTSSIAFSCNVGEPYQGNARQLATDRWNYTYPS